MRRCSWAEVEEKLNTKELSVSACAAATSSSVGAVSRAACGTAERQNPDVSHTRESRGGTTTSQRLMPFVVKTHLLVRSRKSRGSSAAAAASWLRLAPPECCKTLDCLLIKGEMKAASRR